MNQRETPILIISTPLSLLILNLLAFYINES